jgi:hypothetical protein
MNFDTKINKIGLVEAMLWLFQNKVWFTQWTIEIMPQLC